MLNPAPAELLTLYLDRDFELSYSVTLDLTGCTVTSDILDAGGAKVASFVIAITGTGATSTFTRTLTRDAMRAAKIAAGARYTTDICVQYPSTLLVDPLVEMGPIVVKATATFVP